MKKPTKLGYCTTCNAKVYVFDVNGRPVRRKANYREAVLLLSDGHRGRAAFCSRCLYDGVDAKEAIGNLVDGLEADLVKKAWTEEFKEWYIRRYRPLKIMGVEGVLKQDSRGELLPVDEIERVKVKPFRNLHLGPIERVAVTKPPKRFADGSPG